MRNKLRQLLSVGLNTATTSIPVGGGNAPFHCLQTANKIEEEKEVAQRVIGCLSSMAFEWEQEDLCQLAN